MGVGHHDALGADSACSGKCKPGRKIWFLATYQSHCQRGVFSRGCGKGSFQLRSLLSAPGLLPSVLHPPGELWTPTLSASETPAQENRCWGLLRSIGLNCISLCAFESLYENHDLQEGKTTINKQNKQTTRVQFEATSCFLKILQFWLECFQRNLVSSLFSGLRWHPGVAIPHFFSQAFEISQLFSFNFVSLPPLGKSSLIRLGEFKVQHHLWALYSSLGCFSLCRNLLPWCPNSFCSSRAAAPHCSRTHSGAHITMATNTSRFSGLSV